MYQITRQFNIEKPDYFTIEHNGVLLEDEFGNTLRYETVEEAQAAIEELLS